MPAVNYIYSVSADTLNGKVNTLTLSQEIGYSTITIALDHINVAGDVLNIWFKAALASLELTTLSAVLMVHSGTMGVSDTPDTIVAQLTMEGRNLLARAKLGNIVYRQVGWQIGRGGYVANRPVKVTPFIDDSSEAVGYFEIVDNTAWALGTYISLNGKWFIYGTHFVEGGTADLTIQNIYNAILDSTDTKHYQIVAPIIDPLYPNRLYIQSLMTGSISNSYPLLAYHVGSHINFGITYTYTVTTASATAGATYTNNGYVYTVQEDITGGTTLKCTGTGIPTTSGVLTKTSGAGDATVTFSAFVTPTSSPMAGGVSAALEDPSWPIPPALSPYTGTEGLIEIPSSTSLSFMSRVGEGTAGIGAYGELGLWVEILNSSYTPEIGKQVLFAMSHFPIQPKTDRTILTFRVVVSF